MHTPDCLLLLMCWGQDNAGSSTTVSSFPSRHLEHKVYEGPTHSWQEQWQEKLLACETTVRSRRALMTAILMFIFITQNLGFQQTMHTDQFGKKRLADFFLDPDYINLNHGSYGSCPRVVIAAKRKLEEQMDFNTEKWFRFDAEQLLNKTRDLVAKRLRCKTDNLFIVQNATDAYNCLAKSMPWKAGDTVVLPNTAYSSIRKTTEWLRDRYGVKILQVEFTIQDFQNPNKILLKIEDTINSYPGKISLAVFDHIISVPGIVIPIDSIAQFCREKGIPLFVDGAHAMCQVDIDLSYLGVDAYFSNFHKWAFAPKNAAFLYISDKYLNVIRPAITGNFRGEGPARQFFWTGTRDLTSFLVIDKGLEYFDSFGQNRVREHNKALSIEAANRMAAIWKTKKLTEDARMMCYLNNVEVPCDDINLCVLIAKKMLDECNCYPIFYEFNGKVFCRISAQVYNQIADYQFGALTFLTYLNKAQGQKNKIEKE